jgi:hypothetical protein
MYRDEVVQIMTDAINNMNREHGYKMMLPSEQIEETILRSAPELMRVNGMLYDLLVEFGVIKK